MIQMHIKKTGNIFRITLTSRIAIKISARTSSKYGRPESFPCSQFEEVSWTSMDSRLLVLLILVLWRRRMDLKPLTDASRSFISEDDHLWMKYFTSLLDDSTVASLPINKSCNREATLCLMDFCFECAWYESASALWGFISRNSHRHWIGNAFRDDSLDCTRSANHGILLFVT